MLEAELYAERSKLPASTTTFAAVAGGMGLNCLAARVIFARSMEIGTSMHG